MSNDAKQYELFKGRYSVEVGARGGVSIYSKVAHNKKLKIYGKHKDCYRYVNLTQCKGGDTGSYSLVDVVSHCVDGKELIPLEETVLQEMINGVKAPLVLNSPFVIESLEITRDHYGNVQYLEELEHYTRRYQRVDHTKVSNGFLRFSYKVATYCIETKTTTNGRSETFTDKSRIVINDVNKVSEEEKSEIIEALNK